MKTSTSTHPSSTSTVSSAAGSSSKSLLYPWHQFKSQCLDMRMIWKTQGLKALIHRYGWKFFLFVFCYYLVRDITLYLVLPYMIAKMSAS